MYAGIGLPELLLIVLGFGLIALVIAMLIDAIKNTGLSTAQKAIWAVVIIVLYPLGALLYFAMEFRRKRTLA